MHWLSSIFIHFPSGKGNSPEAHRIAQQIDSELKNLFKDVGEAIDNMEFLQNAHSSMVKTLPAARVSS